jgi:drug/metabolite transporter (DMT)-like permease
MPLDRLGELAALGTAVCWTITAMSFESAGKRVGSLTVNLLRLAIAALFFAVYSLILKGSPVPVDAPARTWEWLGLSGFVGFVIGDLLLFQAFVLIGSRVSMLIYSSVPPLTAILGWIVLGETLSPLGIFGMALTVGGIAIVVLQRNKGRPPRLDAAAVQVPHAPPTETEAAAGTVGLGPSGVASLRLPWRGVVFAFGGALGQAGGLVLSKLGAPTFNPIEATQIRGFAGLAGFLVIFLVIRRWRRVAEALRDGRAMIRITVGAFFGPFVGVSAGLYAAQHSTTGIASTIMSLVPVFIIVPSVLFLHERVSFREILGAIVAVAGVSLLFF